MMAQWSLNRLISDAVSTSGQILDPSNVKVCVTVEDAFHAVKIQNQTRIPAGNYKLRLKRLGDSHFDGSYTRIFGDMHHGMIEITGVPGFTGVLIHCGNTILDTDGCILVGAEVIIGPDGYQIEGGTSRPAYQRLYPMLVQAVAAGDCWLRVMDEPGK